MSARGRLQADGVEIVELVADRPGYGFRRFFVASPGGLLIEIVEAQPIPDGLWR